MNLSHEFEDLIDWTFPSFGKLWTYNLNYFDYLNQVAITRVEGLRLINEFIKQIALLKDALEPFPLSLRGMNWIKFIVRYDIKEQIIDDCLYAQYQILMDNLEYHLLGNHLLENGFSLLFGAYYFQEEKLYTKAKAILIDELNEQILEDGAHFELSPMYHQIMLFRVLDCINLLQNNHWKNDALLSLLCKKAALMLGWLNIVTFKNGKIPLLNDSANHIAPTTRQLNDYANRLNIKDEKCNTKLSNSGYRKINKEKYECIVDIGQIGPDYIPGHAHSDTFNFELYINDKPFIVDTGISTYEVNKTRHKERSTFSHNTVQIDGLEQSEMWGGFRVANRAKVIALKENEYTIKAVHDGYKKRIGALHQREFIFSDDSIRIIDNIFSKKNHDAIARLHFHPDVKIKIVDDVVFVNDIQIKQKNQHQRFKTTNYHYSPEFNKQLPAIVLEIPFNNTLDIEILLST
ncbi:MAG: alginate lyase family protein [Methylococcaceae bacterium]